MGLLRIKGVIALDQFWPGGESDADTSKIIVRVERGAFSFAADEKRFRTTHVFDGAKVRGVKKDYVIKNSRIKVRLQGIDAPELHFKAPPLKKTPDVSAEERERYNGANRQFRQFMGESATVALAKKLVAQGGAEVRCEVYSFLDAPAEVIDTYGIQGPGHHRDGGLSLKTMLPFPLIKHLICIHTWSRRPGCGAQASMPRMGVPGPE